MTVSPSPSASRRVFATLDDITVDARTKGMPGGLSTTRLAALGVMGWNVLTGALPLPVAVLRWSAIENNSQWMRKVLATYDVSLCPHGKTTMAPQIFRKQLDDGCWGITLSTPHQVQVARHYGVHRIFFANQIVDPAFLDWLAAERNAEPDFEFFHLVNSLECVAALDAVARRHPLVRPFTVLVEVGSQFARTGSRTISDVLDLAKALAAIPKAAALVEVEGFEGSIRGSGASEIESRVVDFLGLVSFAAEAIEARGLFRSNEVILSAGGSAYFDLVATVLSEARIEQPRRIVLRSGCYIAHNSSMYEHLIRRAMERSPELLAAGKPSPALEVRTYLRSACRISALAFSPPASAIFSSISTCRTPNDTSDAACPHPRRFSPGRTVTALNDQHAYFAMPDGSPLAIGDRVQLGIATPARRSTNGTCFWWSMTTTT